MAVCALRVILARICVAAVVVFSAYTSASAVAGEQRWGVYIEAPTENANLYAISWNYADLDSALAAAFELCHQKTGIPCAPRRLLSNDVWFPDRIIIFSTAASAEGGREVVEDVAYEFRARCILVYSSTSYGRYGVLLGHSEGEVRRMFAKRNQDHYKNYIDPDPLVVEDLVCNNW